MMNHPQAGLIPDSPTALAGPTTQIDVFIVKKEALIQTAYVFEAVPPYEQTASGGPRNLGELSGP
jgi:hypothetical protein